MKKIFVTRAIPEAGIAKLRDAAYDVVVSKKDGVLTKEELIVALHAAPYDAVLSLLTDHIDGDVLDAVPTAKIVANYAVGFDNIDLTAAKERGVTVTNTPGVLTQAVAEHTFALLLAVARRIPESDRFTRAGKYVGWEPELLVGAELKGKTLGLLGAGRIGGEVARIALAFGMKVTYYDIAQNVPLDAIGATYSASVDDVLRGADFVSIHVPLLPTTQHLISAERLALMKRAAYLINTSRGPVIDEVALVAALRAHTIAGAALDVFEYEPALTEGLTELENVVLTPHIASATKEARDAMALLAAENIITFLNGEAPPNKVA
ncbi:hypothetical protein A3C89_00675 [Candidatus Kaiserbacteria bacterium RIFCSPHIGHO2_02_FULL_50_50]|uniref:D-glycerate dehydrogenase n=1 Tax=Candidatus Kaiserbacteria bacterium RIFCSPHIGHO2_02_FULL_50_50 TaxID=1798492 RepID=A0A1F6DFR2_9BACT|nr:MAG: hypothetical protein A3C89_00675 [Candidatus Kaiserbacteria bacterium RIFCSPHIGHO2_02_FULL_50_50]OGG88866.1 MAG: hypothetical protein A3G62_03115 [Candidatus Kaiserbacteria bacterium RIFCSPLOWO2_12_FULL_50_10]